MSSLGDCKVLTREEQDSRGAMPESWRADEALADETTESLEGVYARMVEVFEMPEDEVDELLGGSLHALLVTSLYCTISLSCCLLLPPLDSPPHTL